MSAVTVRTRLKFIKDEFLQERDSFTEDDAHSDCFADEIKC